MFSSLRRIACRVRKQENETVGKRRTWVDFEVESGPEGLEAEGLRLLLKALCSVARLALCSES